MTLSDKERLSILEKQVLILENELKAWKQKEHVAEVLNAERAERTDLEETHFHGNIRGLK